MITAKEAYIKTKYSQHIDKMLKEIENLIESSAEKGFYATKYAISIETSDDTKRYICDYLKNCGYYVTITDSKGINNLLGFQKCYQDYIYINWSETNKGKIK